MPNVSLTALREFRQKYDAAYAAYQSCVNAVNEATMTGNRPAPELVSNEGKAIRELSEARANLLAALAEITGDELATS